MEVFLTFSVSGDSKTKINESGSIQSVSERHTLHTGGISEQWINYVWLLTLVNANTHSVTDTEWQVDWLSPVTESVSVTTDSDWLSLSEVTVSVNEWMSESLIVVHCDGSQ